MFQNIPVKDDVKSLSKALLILIFGGIDVY